jgi:hypothetical protein
MFKITNSTSALLTGALKRQAYFLYCNWWIGSTGNFNFVLEPLQCSRFCGIHRVSRRQTSKSVKSGDRGEYSTVPSFGEANIDKISHIGAVIPWGTVMFIVTVFMRKQNVNATYDALQHC